MMHPNQVLINKFFDAYSKRDMPAIKDVMSDAVKWTNLGQHPYAGVRNGIDEVIAFFDTMGAVMSRSNSRAENLVTGANDKYVLECQHIWSNRTDGHNLDHLVCVLWAFEAGKIVEGRHFFADPKATDDFFNYLATVK